MSSLKTKEGLKRVVGIPALTLTIVNGIIGAGIFTLPGEVSGRLGGFGIYAYLFCSIMMAAIMLCYMEIGSRVTTSGGSYAYVESAFGPFAGFVINWMYFLGWGVLGSAAVINITADSLSAIFPLLADPVVRALILFILLAIMVLINIRGARLAVGFLQVVTVIKLLPLFVLIIVGFGRIQSGNLHWETLPSLKTFSDTLLILFFAFAGFETSLNASGEIKNPKRTLPIAIFIAGIAVLSIYMLLQTIVQGMLGAQIATVGKAPLAAVAQQMIGPAGATLLLVAAAISSFGLSTGDVMATPRLLFAGSNDGLFPKFLGKVHPRFATPWLAIISYAALIFIFAVSGGFRQLAVLASSIIMLIYLAVILATIKLRIKGQPSEEKTFRISGGFTIPIIGIVTIIWLLSSLSKPEVIATIIFIAAVCVIYLLMNQAKLKNNNNVLP